MDRFLEFQHSTVTDGTTVSAMVRVWKGDVNVKLVEPYTGISSGGHVPAFAMSRDTWNLDEDGAITPKGWSSINGHMMKAYRTAEVLYQHRDELLARIAHFESTQAGLLTKLEVKRAEVSRAKVELRKLFRAGRISEKEFVQPQRKQTEAVRALEQDLQDKKQEIFSGLGNFSCSYGSEDEYIEFIKGPGPFQTSDR